MGRGRKRKTEMVGKYVPCFGSSKQLQAHKRKKMQQLNGKDEGLDIKEHSTSECHKALKLAPLEPTHNLGTLDSSIQQDNKTLDSQPYTQQDTLVSHTQQDISLSYKITLSPHKYQADSEPLVLHSKQDHKTEQETPPNTQQNIPHTQTSSIQHLHSTSPPEFRQHVDTRVPVESKVPASSALLPVSTHVIVPSILNSDACNSPCGVDTLEESSPHCADTLEESSPRGVDTLEGSSPCGVDTLEGTSPSGVDIMKDSSPHGADAMEEIDVTSLPLGEANIPPLR